MSRRSFRRAVPDALADVFGAIGAVALAALLANAASDATAAAPAVVATPAIATPAAGAEVGVADRPPGAGRAASR